MEGGDVSEAVGRVLFRIQGLANDVEQANRFITLLAPDEWDRVMHLVQGAEDVYEFFSYAEGENNDVLRAAMLHALASMRLNGEEVIEEHV